MLAILLAQEGGAQSGGGGLGGIIFFLPIALFFYLFLFRPQKRQRMLHEQLMSSLQPGDDIETIGGLFGTIRRLEDDRAWVELSPGTTIQMARRAIRRKVDPDAAPEGS